MCGILHFSQCLKHGLCCILLGWVAGVLIRIRCLSLESIGSVYEIKLKVIPQQAEVAQGVPGRLMPRSFLTFGTTRVVGRQP